MLIAIQRPIKVKAEIIEVKQGDHITCGDIDLEVLETPGHTPGGVCYYMEGLVFVGDTLFRDSVGRTDFPNGSYEILYHRLRLSYIDCLIIQWFILSLDRKQI